MGKKDNNNRPRRKCTSEAQKRAIRASYAKRAAEQRADRDTKPPAGQTAARTTGVDQPCRSSEPKSGKSFPDRFPFWARLKISKNRTTLVIDEDEAYDKQYKKTVEGYVHREATHSKGQGERIYPNPDPDDKDPMYLKSPSKLPKRLFKPHNKSLNMPQDLIDRYDKNNNKPKPSDPEDNQA